MSAVADLPCHNRPQIALNRLIWGDLLCARFWYRVLVSAARRSGRKGPSCKRPGASIGSGRPGGSTRNEYSISRMGSSEHTCAHTLSDLFGMNTTRHGLQSYCVYGQISVPALNPRPHQADASPRKSLHGASQHREPTFLKRKSSELCILNCLRFLARNTSKCLNTLPPDESALGNQGLPFDLASTIHTIQGQSPLTTNPCFSVTPWVLNIHYSIEQPSCLGFTLREGGPLGW